MFNIKKELKKVPQKPGVYLMKDEENRIIYVGKAKKLKNRLSSYFNSDKNKRLKTKILVSNIETFEYIITDNEVEALLLEENLIKKNKPKYNVLLKDDKTFPYIKVTVNEDFPKVIKVRKIKKDGSKYFGPFVNVYALNEMMKIIFNVWKIRTCNRVLPRDIGKKRPCLNYHIDRCEAPCAGYISSEEYKKEVDKVIKFLKGDNKHIIKKLEKDMKIASSNLEYERAQEIKEQIESLRDSFNDQKVSDVKKIDRDHIGVYKNIVTIFFVRKGKMIGKKQFNLNQQDEVLNGFVKSFYLNKKIYPHEILLSQDIEDREILAEYLSEKNTRKVKIKIPQRGKKAKLNKLAVSNSKLKYNQVERKKKENLKIKKELKTIFDKDINRIESYDISNISGYDSVGAMIVYKNGKFVNNEYRKFKIKTVTGADDYSSIKEVIRRRFKNKSEKFKKMPDLILIDGGKGQINSVKSVLDKLEIKILVAGMIKDDKHNTRGLIFNNKEVEISSELLKVITKIQDEVHRFAISYHKTLRTLRQSQSILDNINGIGQKRKMKLIRHFKSLDNIKKADINQLEDVLSKNIAKKVYKYFRK